MAHLSNLQNGIQDCSRGGFYHNKRFKATAEMAGLIVEYSNKYGWAFTKATDETVKFLETVSVDKDEFRLTRNSLRKLIPIENSGGNIGGGADDNTSDKPKRKGSFRKYTCPLCTTAVRATKDVNVKCGDCEVTMVKEGG
jgi:hypothetical protein